jgi:hypothetical protein
MKDPFLRNVNSHLGTVGTTLCIAFIVLKLTGASTYPWWGLAVPLFTPIVVAILAKVIVVYLTKRTR